MSVRTPSCHFDDQSQHHHASNGPLILIPFPLKLRVEQIPFPCRRHVVAYTNPFSILFSLQRHDHPGLAWWIHIPYQYRYPNVVPNPAQYHISKTPLSGSNPASCAEGVSSIKGTQLTKYERGLTKSNAEIEHEGPAYYLQHTISYSCSHELRFLHMLDSGLARLTPSIGLIGIVSNFLIRSGKSGFAVGDFFA